ncbi:MAG: hypothetical protein IJV71_07605, partial [Lachnospiraceae bacterium]|nr:hypothetical protein [Lachnospiraceae bacterium]
NVSELMKEEEFSREEQPAIKETSWTCSCGMFNTMKFCPNCGNSKPAEVSCSSCGMVIPKEYTGMKFCPNCGKER